MLTPTLAVLILAAKSPSGLGALASYFDDPRMSLYIHVDPKFDEAPFRQLAEHGLFHPNPQPVFWRGFTMVEATVRLIRFALEQPISHSHFILLSDDSIPLVSTDRIIGEILRLGNILDAETRPNGFQAQRYHAFHLHDTDATTVTWVPIERREITPLVVQRVMRLEVLRQRGKKPLPQIYQGSQWWALTREAVLEIIKSFDDDIWLRDSFEFTDVPDESYIQTIVRSGSGKNQPSDLLMYTDWTGPKPPRSFSTLQEILEVKTEALFLRKCYMSFEDSLAYIRRLNA